MIFILVYIFLFSILILSIVALFFSVNALYNLFKVKVPYVPTPAWAIETLIKKYKTNQKKTVIDLGTGDARVLIAFKKSSPNIKAVGFEVAWWPYLKAKGRIKRSRAGIDLRKENFYNTNLAEADIIFCFLIDSIMPKLEKKLLNELKPGTTVISYGFTFPNWQPKEIIANPKKPKGSKIHIYEK